MARGTRRSDIKGRLTPRRLSLLGWFWRRSLAALKVAGAVACVVGFVLWIWAQGYLVRAQDWAGDRIARAGASVGLVVGDVVVIGRHYVDTPRLKAAIGVEPGAPILGVDLDGVQSRLSSISWVKSVHVRRVLPDRLIVSLNERLPVALWVEAPGGPAVIDAEGVVLTRIDVGSFGPLLALEGKGCETVAGDLIALLEGQPDLAVRVKKGVRVSGRRWDLVLSGGMILRLPEDDPGFALARAAKAQLQERVLDQDLKAIDLRQNDRIILENKPGQTRDLLLKGGSPV